jgi:[ribosomal protein S18]-alanine N-acetyltransferase
MPGLADPPTAKIPLRPATPADLDALVRLENQVFDYDVVSRQSFRRFLASPSASLIVAQHAGMLAGYVLVLLRRGNRIARLYSVAVNPRRTGHGLGTRLIVAAEQAARRRGATALRLDVHEGNVTAINRYRKLGYVPYGRRPGYYTDGGNALCFEKRLPPSSTGDKDSSSPAGLPAR